MPILRARVFPTVGTPATLRAEEALAIFWADHWLWRKLAQVDGNDDLPSPKIEARGPDGVVFRVDGASGPRRCDCGWPMLRTPSLDEPIIGLDGTWRGWRCAADPSHTYLEPR